MIARRVTCAVILREGRVLLARRAPGQKHAGLWEFPGGKTEPGESDEACLEREIREEFGVSGRAGEHLCDSAYTYNDLGMQILLCAYRFYPKSEAFQKRVHDEIRYFDREQLAQLAMTPADVPIARRAAEMLLSGENP